MREVKDRNLESETKTNCDQLNKGLIANTKNHLIFQNRYGGETMICTISAQILMNYIGHPDFFYADNFLAGIKGTKQVGRRDERGGKREGGEGFMKHRINKSNW